MKISKVVIILFMAITLIWAIPVADLDSVAAAGLEQSGKIGKLTINNKIGGRIYVTFEGPKNFAFFVGDGKTIQEMEQGEYTYSFFADGDTVVGTVKLKSSASIVMKLIRGKLTLNNKISGNVYLLLDGPRDYNFWAAPGKTIHELVPGTYQYSYYADGGREKGEFTLKKSGGILVLKIEKGKLRINSKFSQSIFTTFTGPIPYYLWVIPGRNILEMRVGTYKYSYWYDGKNHQGSVDLLKKGSTLILDPPKVCECKKNLYNCSDFSTGSEAQACFLYCKGQGRGDVHRLGGDKDGRACEALW